jgi:hypothetical protein
MLLTTSFGRANCWLPKWFDKILPHLAVDPIEKKNNK